jgi:MbtH protein
MAEQYEDDGRTYTVVINHEEQYSIWPVTKALPAGWNEVGKTGSKPACLLYIDEVWTDMRPLSLRIAMGDAAPSN